MDHLITFTLESEPIKYLCKQDKRLEKIILQIGPISYSPYSNCYYFLVRTIIGQMLSNISTDIIVDRLLKLCGGDICVEKIRSLEDEKLRSIGISRKKITYIRCLTNQLIDGYIDFYSLSTMSDDDVIKALTSIHGIGKWSAKMYLIFVLNRQDVLPFEDGAFLQSYKCLYGSSDLSPISIQKKCHKWKPYSSIAARYLYKALDSGLTKKEIYKDINHE